MNTQAKNIVLMVVTILIIIIGAIIFIVRPIVFPAADEGSKYIYGFDLSPLVTKEINPDIEKMIPEGYGTVHQLAGESINTVDKTVTMGNTNIWCVYQDGSWIMYATEDTGSLYTFTEALRKIIGTSEFDINTEIDQKGYIGISSGGYRAGTVTVNDDHYLIMQNYLDSWNTCAALTLDPGWVNTGKMIIDTNIRTMIEDTSLMEGTDEDSDNYTYSDEESNMILDEFYNNAYYQDLAVKKDFEKLRMLFTSEHYENITKIYVRNKETQEVYYPVDTEEHDENECVFVISNVPKDTELQIVMFADQSPGNPEVALMEYEESATVKNRENSNEAPDTTETPSESQDAESDNSAAGITEIAAD